MKTGTSDLTASAFMHVTKPDPNTASPKDATVTTEATAIAQPGADMAIGDLARQRPDTIDWSLGERARAALERQSLDQGFTDRLEGDLTDRTAVSLSQQLRERLGEIAQALGGASVAAIVMLAGTPF